MSPSTTTTFRTTACCEMCVRCFGRQHQHTCGLRPSPQSSHTRQICARRSLSRERISWRSYVRRTQRRYGRHHQRHYWCHHRHQLRPSADICTCTCGTTSNDCTGRHAPPAGVTPAVTRSRAASHISALALIRYQENRSNTCGYGQTFPGDHTDPSAQTGTFDPAQSARYCTSDE